jgi:CsbD-like
MGWARSPQAASSYCHQRSSSFALRNGTSDCCPAGCKSHSIVALTSYDSEADVLISWTVLAWGRLTDDDLDVINGRQDQLEGKIQERYGLAKDQAKKM